MTTTWFAIRVAPQTEFKVLHALNQQERPSLLPTEEKWIEKKNGKTDTKRFPLFASYVFAGFLGPAFPAWVDFTRIRDNINEAEKLAGRAAPIIGLLGFGKKPSSLSGDEISALERMSRGAPAHPSTIEFEIGQRIRVVNHPLIPPVEGTVTAVRKAEDNRRIVRAILDRLGSRVVVDLQPSNVEAA